MQSAAPDFNLKSCSQGSRSEIAENGDVFSALSHIAMGPFAAERAGAVEIMTDLCEDEKLHGSLMASGSGPVEFTLLLHL